MDVKKIENVENVENVKKWRLITPSNKCYTLVRFPVLLNVREFVRWEIITKNYSRKIYPKWTIFIVLSSVLFKSYLNYDKKCEENCQKRREENRRVEREYEDLRKKYQQGKNDGMKFITNDKIDPIVLSNYVDFIAHIENEKKLRANSELMNAKKEEYKGYF